MVLKKDKCPIKKLILFIVLLLCLLLYYSNRDMISIKKLNDSKIVNYADFKIIGINDTSICNNTLIKIAIAGIFHTGTNAMVNLLKANCFSLDKNIKPYIFIKL